MAGVPAHTAAQLTSLTMEYTDAFSDMADILRTAVGASPLLQHLYLPSHFASLNTLGLLALPVPHLVTFSGPFCVALGIALAEPPALTHFAITVQSIPSTADALFLIDHIRSTSLINIALLLKHWDDQVFSRIAEVSPRCEEVGIVCEGGCGPSQTFLSSLGLHLQRLASLRAVHIYPKVAVPRGKSGSGIASADPRAFAEVWGLSSPQLRRVKLSSSVAWARRWENGPWDRYTLKEVDERHFV
ncbi:hypothetical protein DFH08DRAFT_117652 [Mycena albidolilacea]|uniref:Uncharacterized protein n=1 Tax=Mycena albidolilacea TaxID=1033008 RepID=A0AAD7A7X1_9AGAR|nr:hypothetical protein DFH08DRAFT_117652 [Mycena albidolilacea]